MATEYISREEASDLLEMALSDDWEPEYAQDRLSEIPAADVVEVVRCKDCKFSWKTDESDLSDLEYKCIFRRVFVSEEWYCADGQRRQNRI